ncbi:MAG: PocR ligand-binding domain-containing protein [Desulforhabdus sp.]|jgi:two-component system response regulator YesN|nr:PocR ligand-binding domain-containing protein [Desulforhabdus sp.]
MQTEYSSKYLEEKLFSRILDSYREAIKLEVRLFQVEDEEGVRSIEGHGHPFCYTIRTSMTGRKKCLKDVNRAIQISLKTGEPYIFQCHAGVIEFTAALMDAENNAAAFVCGPVLLRHLDSYTEQHFLSRMEGLPLDKAVLMKLLTTIPVRSERKVQAAADLLFLIASYFSRIDLLARHQQLEISRQQSLLAEEIFLGKILQSDDYVLPSQPVHTGGSFYKEKELIDLIKIGDRKKAKALLDEILGPALFRSNEHLGILKARALEVVFVIARAAVEAGANLEEILGFKYQCVQNLSKDDGQETLYYFLMKAFDQLFACIYQNRNIRHTAVFTKAKEYIWKNYNQEISLRGLADAVGMNPYYLSHLFRKEMGTSFQQYLTSVRISIAKSLLQQTDKSMIDICLEVGYQDPSYFAKIFKRNEGVQPTEYRKKAAPK